MVAFQPEWWNAKRQQVRAEIFVSCACGAMVGSALAAGIGREVVHRFREVVHRFGLRRTVTTSLAGAAGLAIVLGVPYLKARLPHEYANWRARRAAAAAKEQEERVRAEAERDRAEIAAVHEQVKQHRKQEDEKEAHIRSIVVQELARRHL
jgi:hypothetical protein